MADSAKSILIELLENGRHSRAALAQKLHRSRPAISTAVDKLISRGFLQVAGVAKSSGGKPRTMLEFTEKSLCAIGLTIGAENTMRSVLLDGNARIIAQLDKRFNNNISSIAAAAMESIARQPDAAGDIRSSLIISMAMMEALTIYGLLIAFMLVAKV